MILKDLLAHFDINVDLPQYLYDESFNPIFLKGNLIKKDNAYTIEIETHKNMTHTMIISPSDDYPLTVISRLPNSSLNGMKFGLKKDDTQVIDSF